jgi:uncharacterized protein
MNQATPAAVATPDAKSELGDRIKNLDWDEVGEALHDHGYAVTPSILSAGECCELAASFDDDDCFRTIIDMSRYRFGSGTYKYFKYPLPVTVQQLRSVLYAPLAVVANEWAARTGSGETFPATLDALCNFCHQRGQNRPTPLIFRYHAGDYNTLHQDVYGAIGFPFQVLTLLGRPGHDFTGGEFLLVTQRPRAQSIAEVITAQRGQLLIFPNRIRPMRGQRGWYRANVRHGVSRVHSGTRHTLGIIFHDAAE